MLCLTIAILGVTLGIYKIILELIDSTEKALNILNISVVFAYFLFIFAFCIIGNFFKFHILLVTDNKTTLEDLSKQRPEF